MNEQEALSRMVAPGTRRPGKYREGVIQIHVTRACDKACFGCTQGSQLGGNPGMITVEQFETAVKSLVGYFGVVGVFGGNPALHPRFEELCDVLAKYIPYEQRGLWCNNPINESKALAMQRTFNPAVSNLNVHLDQQAYALFRRYWPEARPVGGLHDSRHAPCYVAMKDVIPDEGTRWELISDCDINKHWSAMIGVFRGEVRAWFCEIAGAQAMLHQWDRGMVHVEKDGGPGCGRYTCDREGYTYPDTGYPVAGPDGVTATYGLNRKWWELPMVSFADQVRKHCHECSVPLRGYGELAQAKTGNPVPCPTCDGNGLNPDADEDDSCEHCNGTGRVSSPQEAREQVSETHRSVFRPKDKARRVELVTVVDQIQPQALGRMTDYIGNSKR